MFDWLWPDWHPDTTGAVKRVEIPEAGGWMYQFRGGDATYSHVFVPNMASWTDAISAAIGPDRPISIALDFSRVTKTKQDVPMKGNN